MEVNQCPGYKKNLVGQAYDGASVTSGKHSEVQARIKEEAKSKYDKFFVMYLEKQKLI